MTASWRRLICTIAMSKGTFGYLDGTITSLDNKLSAEIPWDSETPSPKK